MSFMLIERKENFAFVNVIVVELKDGIVISWNIICSRCSVII
jgi:hypothetical protein